MSEQLKPCPFCGSMAYIERIHGKRNKDFPYRVKCTNANCGCRTTRWSGVSGAIKAWNRRESDG